MNLNNNNMAQILENKKSEKINKIFEEMDIKNMDKRQIFMLGVGVGRGLERGRMGEL